MSSDSGSRISQLNETQLEAVQQFKLITGLNEHDENNGIDNKDNDDIISLLTINEFNVNNTINTFFESGFESVKQPTTTTASDIVDSERSRTPLETFSSGIDIHDENSNIHNRRRESGSGSNTFNLQQQFFVENFLPRLPKAPRISNGWQLEVGIHTSIIEKRLEEEQERQRQVQLQQEMKEKDDERIEEKEIDDSTTLISESSSSQTRKFHVSFWLILLIIPRTLLNLIISAFRYLFGFNKSKSLSSSSSSLNRLPKSFNYEQDFDPTYKFIPWIDDQFKQLKTTDEDGPATNATDLFTNFNLEDSNFNLIHEKCQKNYVWLVVIIINSSEESIKFLHSLVNDPHFNRLFNKLSGEFKETIIYINNVSKSPEIFEVGTIYKIKRIPYIMLVGNISSSPEIMSSMSILYKSNLDLTGQVCQNKNKDEEEIVLNKINRKIFKNIHKLMESFQPQLISKRFDMEEMKIARLIKEEQDSAYQRSLKQDQIKKIERERLLSIQNSAALKQKLRLKFLLNLIKSDFHNSVTNNTKEDNTRLAIRLPDGRRLVNSFDKSLSVNMIYLYIEVILMCDNDNEIDEVDDDITNKSDLTPGQYFESYNFNFEIFQPFPKKVIVPNDEQIGTINEFISGSNLLVEYKDEEDEGDNEETEFEGNEDDNEKVSESGF